MTTNSINTIISSNNIQEIPKHILPKLEAQSLVLFDFDDTLVMSGSTEAAHLGGVKWREDLRKYITDLKQSNAITSNAPLFECLTLFIAKSLTAKAVQDSQTAKIISDLEAQGCKVMIFTARGRSGENAWYKLNITGIDALTKHQMQQAGITIRQHPTSLSHASIYEDMIIFSQNSAKDQLLKELFAKKVFNASEISQILFIDDKKEQVEKVGKAASDHSVSYTGVHYTLIDEIETREYDLLKSTVQLVSLLATQVLLNQRDLAISCNKISEEGIIAEEFFKQTLTQLDELLSGSDIYRQIGLDPDKLFEKIKQAVSGHFKNAKTL
jgi:uncharacterized protein DUF2608